MSDIWDQQFDGDTEVDTTDQEKSKKKPPPISLQLINLILESDAILFHDQFGEGYVAPFGDGSRIERLRSRHFRSWLHYHALTLLDRAVSSNVVVDAMYTLEGLARHSGTLHPLSVRVAVYDNAIWYDLGGSAVRISPDGWEILERPPILFQRFSHQRPQVIPEHGGSLDQLDAVLPSSMRPEHRLLFKVSLVTGLVPHIPQTVDVIFGDHGSAKSTITKVKKALLDPSFIEEFTPPNSLNAFVQLLAHHTIGMCHWGISRICRIGCRIVLRGQVRGADLPNGSCTQTMMTSFIPFTGLWGSMGLTSLLRRQTCLTGRYSLET